MRLPLLTLFLLVSLVHLWASAAQCVALRRITKPLLMPLMMGFYLLSAAHPQPLAAAALLCGFVGDVALVMPGAEEQGKKPHPLLLVGLGAFLLGHLCYIALFLGEMAAPPPVWTIPLPVAVALGLFLLIFLNLRPHMGVLTVIGTVYLAVLLAMALSAGVSGLAAAELRRPLGGLCFVLSDYILARSILLGEKRYTHAAVMLTYLTAQSLLVLSLL